MYMFGCNRSIMKDTLLEERSTFSTVLPSIRGIFLNLHTYQSLRIRCNWYKFRCDGPIKKGNSHEEQSTFSNVSGLLLQRSFWISTPFTHCTCYKCYKFGCHQWIMDTLLEEQITPFTVSIDVLERSFRNSTPFFLFALCTTGICLVASALYLQNQVPSRLCLAFCLRDTQSDNYIMRLRL